MRHILARIFERGELRDPALHDVPLTITEVRVSPDLKRATAYVMPLGGGNTDKVMEGLKRGAPHLRQRIAQEVQLRVAPQITFALDESFDEASRIEALLRREEVARDLKAGRLMPRKRTAPETRAATMARKRRGQPVHGWIVLDKPLGMSSSQAVGAVRRLLDAAKAGHAGTLDPLATGVLPIALGEATKTVAYAMGSRKRYSFTVRWGVARSTDDLEGEITAESTLRPSQEQVLAALSGFEGVISQRPPDFSAIKVNGKRAYDLARRRNRPGFAPRPVEIHGLTLTDRPDADHAEFEAEVGKGTYIRAIARDLGAALGCYGHVTALRRLAVGCFTLDGAISLDKLAAVGHSPAASGHLLPIETALDDIPALALSGEEAEALRCGRVVTPLRPSDRARVDQFEDGATIRATSDGRLVALAAVEKGLIRPVRVMNL